MVTQVQTWFILGEKKFPTKDFLTRYPQGRPDMAHVNELPDQIPRR